MKHVSETKAAKSISAYVILRNGEYFGKIQCHHGESRCIADVWLGEFNCGKRPYDTLDGEYTQFLAEGSASGYGYNKEAHAIADAISKFKFIDEQPTDLFDYQAIAKLESCGPRALEDILGVTVIQAI